MLLTAGSHRVVHSIKRADEDFLPLLALYPADIGRIGAFLDIACRILRFDVAANAGLSPIDAAVSECSGSRQ
jgi:hypothetical protein